MSFTLDGHTIETVPATMVSLACGNYALLTGRIDTGDWVGCEDCGPVSDEQDTLCQVIDVVRTEIVPTVHID